MNPYINTDETEIDLLALGKYLLRKIIWILIGGIVCAAIGGGYQYLQSKRYSQTIMSEKESETETEAETETETETEQWSELDMELFEQQSELIKTTDDKTMEIVRAQQDYLKDSLYMQIDPSHVQVATAIIRIVSHDKEYPSYQLAEVYKNALVNGEYLSDLAEEYNTNVSYLKEMLNVTSVKNSTGNSDFTISFSDEERKDISEMFVIYVAGSTSDEACSLRDAMLDELNNIQKSLKNECSHDMSVVYKTSTEAVDINIKNGQRDATNYINTILTQIKDRFDKSAWLEGLMMENEKPETHRSVVTLMQETETVVSAVTEKPAWTKADWTKEIVKFSLIGLIVGIFLMCLWFVLLYIHNNILGDYKDLEQKGIFLKELGSLPGQNYEMVAANIRAFGEKKKRLYVTGLADEELFKKTLDGMKQYLDDYCLVPARDALHDPKAREQVVGCDAAILIEQKGASGYSDMKEEIIFLVNAEKEIIGIVIV